MARIKISVLIPYKQRLSNLRLVFEGLTRQTMNALEFEVVVGAMEYCAEYLALCKEYIHKLNIISVVSNNTFAIPKARNLAMKQASGEIALQMDADTLLSPYTLERLYDENFAFGQKICIVGQVTGYDNNAGGDVKNVKTLAFAEYEVALDKLEKTHGNPQDPRFQVSHILPWAFGWTGLIALPLTLVKEYNMYFDETFAGWGVDDLEWSYRICNSNTPIVLKENIRALHLPHTRDQGSNAKSEAKNYSIFLKKWPRLDVELAYALGDVKANSVYAEYKKQIENVLTQKNNCVAVVRCRIQDKDIIYIGVEVTSKLKIVDKVISNLVQGSKCNMIPLLGIALPYQDQEIEQCYITSKILKLPSEYKNLILKEVSRVAASYKIME